MLFVSIDILACRGPSLQRTKADILNLAMEENPIAVIARVKEIKDICVYSDALIRRSRVINGQRTTEEIEEGTECFKGALLLEVIDSFNKPAPQFFVASTESRTSCDVGELQPIKSITENGKIKKVKDYLVGLKYLFVISNKSPSKHFYIRAAEKYSKSTEVYIKKYLGDNTANKSSNADAESSGS